MLPAQCPEALPIGREKPINDDELEISDCHEADHWQWLQYVAAPNDVYSSYTAQVN